MIILFLSFALSQQVTARTHSPYAFREQQTPPRIPVGHHIDPLGWAHMLPSPKLSLAFWRRNLLRAQIVQNNKTIPLQKVLTTYTLDPKSSDGRFLLEYYLHLVGKQYKLPTSPLPLTDRRAALLAFFASLKVGDLKALRHRLRSFRATTAQYIRLTLSAANQLKKKGFLSRSYTLYRFTLSLLEAPLHVISLSKVQQQQWYRYVVLTLAEISTLKGKYRKAHAILKWVPKEEVVPPRAEVVDCTVKAILADRCQPKQLTPPLPSPLIAADSATKAYHKALLQWRLRWSNAPGVFRAFLTAFPKDVRAPKTKKFLLWLKFNPK